LHKLFAEQLAKATRSDAGELDIDKLAELVGAEYDEADRDRRRLLDAFDLIPEGVVVFDKEDRYVLWNKRFAEIYSGTGSTIEIGARFEDLLRSSLLNRQFPEATGREGEWLAKRLARHRQPANTEIQHLTNDRWVRIDERRTADGGSIGVRIDITELKQREESFRLLFESNPLPMLVCAEKSLQFIAVNDASVAHYGYSREQFLRMSVFDLRTPEDQENAQWLAQSGEGNRQAGATRRHIKADGSIIDVAVYSRPLRYDGQAATLFAAIDLTARKRAEDEVREAREFLNAIVDNVPVTVTVKDARDFRYLLVNRAAEKFFGFPRDQIVGRTVHEIFPKEAADGIHERDRKLLTTGLEVILDDRPFHVAKDGARYLNSRRLTLPDANGKPRYLLGVIEDITVLKTAEARIAHLANHDSLTDLPNRAAFDEHMSRTLERAAATGEEFGVICLDLDRFKGINDVFGHGAGDAVLQKTARRFKALAKGAFLARPGGDEFTLIVPGAPQPLVTESLAEKLQAAMADDIEAEGQRFKVRLSIGVALYPLDGSDAKSLIDNADAALYRAKADGRGAIRFFEAEMDKQLRERRALHHELRAAVEREELFLNYQPQARMNSEIVGFEALARWQHSRLGMIPPETFIPLAEESGIIIQLGEWILREACREAASWQRPMNIAVNLSPAQFQHSDLPSLVHSILLETGLAAHRLELEITEGVLIHDYSHAMSVLRRLKSLGVRIAMDDFGTGYSSLSYLQAFPFDKIKIDSSFISNLERSPQSVAIIRAVIGLGRGLDIPVVAEGVETQDQLDFLTHEACSEVQGYLIGRPLPIGSYGYLLGDGSREDEAQQAI
jgi:diguanylate cyclase (GGDEF)-like protein/PAS domain S-box-containing protein